LLGALASLALIAAFSLLVGQAVLALCGRRDFTWLAGPVGLALLLVVAGVAIRLPGHGTAVAVAVVIVAVVAALIVWRRPARGFLAAAPAGLAAGALAALLAAIPFIAAGRVGILGVGLVNDDMSSHLLLADWLDTRFSPEPVLIHQGYPVGPHALMAGVSSLFGIDLIDAFAGLVLAIPALTALVALEAMARLRTAVRVAAAALVALPYMAAAYLAQEAFKEPIMALFLLGFALLLPTLRDWRSAIPLGVIAAGSVYAYSFPGLFWLAGTVVLWGGMESLRTRRLPDRRPIAVIVGAGLAVLLIATAPDWGRIVDFTHFRAFDPSRANEGGLGNLHGYLSPLEALGIWPTSEFRLSAGAGSLPAAAFYLGALIAAAALVVALPRWIRRFGWAVPAGLGTAVVIYAGARAFGTVYTSGKALAITAPLVMLVALGGLLEPTRRRLPLVALAAALAAGAALSSFLVLRQAPVAPEDHMEELAQIRPLVEGKKLLFLGRDNFVLYELRGSKPFTHVRNFYDPYFVKPNFDLKNVGSKFDFDAVRASTLARFPYVLTTRAAYASGPPPGYQAVLETPSYLLWRAEGAEIERDPVESNASPGRPLPCRQANPAQQPAAHSGPGFFDRALGGARVAVFDRAPIVGDASGWSSTTVEDGSPVSRTLDLPKGKWEISIQYDATRPVTLSAAGSRLELPGNLDYRGVTPYWPAGQIEVGSGGAVRMEASVERLPLAGRLLGAHSVAHLGAIAATPVGRDYVSSARSPAPGTGERIVRGPAACGAYADWSSGGRFSSSGP
jgi:hypothetical protein